MNFVLEHVNGITRAIHMFVVLVNHHQLTEVEIPLLAEFGVTANRMRFDKVALFIRQAIVFRENGRGNKSLAEIVEQRTPLKFLPLDLGEFEFFTDEVGIEADTF